MRQMAWTVPTMRWCHQVLQQGWLTRARRVVGIAYLSAIGLGALGAASAAGFDQFIGFGDSTMDSGYFGRNPTGSPQLDAAIRITVAAGGSGAFAGPGEVDTTLLAARFGLNATPFIVTGGGGTNYANGAAQAVASFAINGQGLPNNVPIVTQISNYTQLRRGSENPSAR